MGFLGKSIIVFVGGCMAVGFAMGALEGAGVKLDPPPARAKSEADEAMDRCTSALVASYGFYSIKGWPGASDKWRDHGGKGSYDSLWTVVGKNAFGMPVENVIECEAARAADGSWGLPVLWNATVMGDRLDPGTLEQSPRHRRRESKDPD